MNIRRYILSLLLLCSCLAAMSAVAVPDVRSVVRQDGAVVESTDYYPYGTPFTTANSVQPYKYGSKELDRMHGLDLYDSEARWYDSLIGRTSTIDPLAEKYYSLSPYLWCAGNPVKYIDPDGKDWYQPAGNKDAIPVWIEGSAEIEGYTNIGSTAHYSVDGVTLHMEQNELVEITENVLSDKDWRSQMTTSGKKRGDEGNCFYQSGKMVESSGTQSTGGTINNIRGERQMQDYMDTQINAGYSVRVHVDRSTAKGFDGVGDHWVAISSRTTNLRTGKVSYNFFDPGTYHIERGTKKTNQFQLINNAWISTTYSDDFRYKLVNVRKNMNK